MTHKLPELKRVPAVISLFMLIIITVVSCDSGSIQLVKHGATKYKIVIPESSDSILSKAAQELQNYIFKSTAVELTLETEINISEAGPKIYLGLEKLPVAGIRIAVENRDLLIQGNSSDDVLNAVYVFLEDYLGCKWYAPGVVDVPEHKIFKISKTLNIQYTPEIRTRTVHSRIFYEHPEFAAAHKVTTEAFPFYVPEGRVHTFNRFLPEDQYYETHPEYYALRGNRRLPTQLCLTNPDVLELMKQQVAYYFEKYPEARVISVSTNDNQQYCQDAGCKAMDELEGGPTGTLINFVNEVAKSFPNKTISTLAYQYTRKPSRVVPEENVLITLCSIECDRSGPIEDKCKAFAADLQGWRKLTENIRIWDYTTQFTNFLAPFPNLHTIQPNIKFFEENHARWIFEQHSNNPSELFELRSYIMAKLLWNPNLSFKELLIEFTDGYYEEGGAFVRQYVELIHQKIQEHPDFFLFLYGDPSQGFDSFLSSDLLMTYRDLFDKAEEAVADKPIIVERIRKARLSTDYAMLEAGKKNMNSEFSLVTVNNGEKVPNKKMIEILDRFQETCLNSDITMMNEMGYGVAEYISNYNKTIAVAIKPNKASGKPVTLLTTPKKYADEDPQTLTDGALGGNNFYANWLGFEGNNMEFIVDMESEQEISSISMAFLQVTNHIVFYPLEVQYFGAGESGAYHLLATHANKAPLAKTSKVNEIQYYDANFEPTKVRFIKIIAKNMNEAPYWHHAAGLPSWVFADEIIIN